MYKNKEKIINISGICTNCINGKECDFLREFKVFIRDKKCADKIIDSEMNIFSCERYENEKDAYPVEGVCLNCK